MATTAEVQKLAALARIRIADAELEQFTSEFDAILAYVGQLETLDLSAGGGSASGGEGEKPPLHNVMRVDNDPHVAGIHTEKLAEQFPAREGNALSVKQILTHE